MRLCTHVPRVVDAEQVVGIHARTCWDDFADDDVFFQADQRVALGVDGSFGKHASRFLERRRRQPRIRGDRCFGDAHQFGATFSSALAFFGQTLIGFTQHAGIDSLAGQERCVTRILHDVTTRHLTQNQFDVLVVNGYALVAIHALHFFDDVRLCVADTTDFKQFLGVNWPVGEQLSGNDGVAVLHLQFAAQRQNDRHFGATVVNHVDNEALAVVGADAHHTCGAGQRCRTAWVTCFKQFHDSWQTTSNVFTSDTTRVEGTHGQLGSRLTN